MQKIASPPGESFFRLCLALHLASKDGGVAGTWRQITTATVTADPAAGTNPTGYLIMNVTDGAVKRHAGAYTWELKAGAAAASKVGFHGAQACFIPASAAET